MRTLEQVRSAVMTAVRPLSSEQVPVDEALGRILATDIRSPDSVPPFENSAMDGFAVRAEDVVEPGSLLRVIGDLPAGTAPSLTVGPGEAVRIMTGAPIPAGADTVVRVEDTESMQSTVRISSAVERGTSVRHVGGDVVKGQMLFDKGTRLSSMHIGVLATVGITQPAVSRRPTVGYMSTGDELVAPDHGNLEPGMIRDSNRPMLAALLDEAGVESFDLGIVPDDEASLRAALAEAMAFDVLITTGGVSMGDYDVTKLVLSRDAGVEFWKIAIQPAKPFAFGHLGDTLFFGLPGNPVSVLVSFEQFARPALLAMQGANLILRPQMWATAGEELVSDPEKTVFLRVVFTGEEDGLPVIVRSGAQGSNVLSAAAAADGFAVIPRGTGQVRSGDRVLVEMFKFPETREYVPNE